MKQLINCQSWTKNKQTNKQKQKTKTKTKKNNQTNKQTIRIRQSWM